MFQYSYWYHDRYSLMNLASLLRSSYKMHKEFAEKCIAPRVDAPQGRRNLHLWLSRSLVHGMPIFLSQITCFVASNLRCALTCLIESNKSYLQRKIRFTHDLQHKEKNIYCNAKALDVPDRVVCILPNEEIKVCDMSRVRLSSNTYSYWYAHRNLPRETGSKRLQTEGRQRPMFLGTLKA